MIDKLYYIAGIRWMVISADVTTWNYNNWIRNFPYKKVGNFYIFTKTWEGSYHIPSYAIAWYATYQWAVYTIADTVAKIAADMGKTVLSYDYVIWNSWATSYCYNYYHWYKPSAWNEWMQANTWPFHILQYIEMV